MVWEDGRRMFLTPSEKSAAGDSFPCLFRPASLSPARLLHVSGLAYINCSSLGVYKSISGESIFIKTLIWLHPSLSQLKKKKKLYLPARTPSSSDLWWVVDRLRLGVLGDWRRSLVGLDVDCRTDLCFGHRSDRGRRRLFSFLNTGLL